MHTGSALLHRWSAALEEYDFTVKHRPRKAQTHVDGLSRLPVDPPPPEDTPEFVETIRQWLQLTHQQMAAPPVALSPNPYQEGSLVYVLTTPPERTSKLAPRWKGPFRVCRIPNDYQVTYEDDGVERTVHINHVKPTKFAAPDNQNPCRQPNCHARR